MNLEERCELLRSLHTPGRPLILPNAWDVASAKAIVGAGFPAVATTSAGIASALGYEDHEGAPANEMLNAAGRIARSVDVPVTVDAEAGYGMSAAEFVRALRGLGAAGCNLEDTDHRNHTLVDPRDQAEHLSAIRAVAAQEGYPLVINARIDTFLAYQSDPQKALSEGQERARFYFESGADCVYPIFLHKEDDIEVFVANADGPVNILALPQAPPISRLASLNVARVSFGSLLHHQAMQQLTSFLHEQLKA